MGWKDALHTALSATQVKVESGAQTASYLTNLSVAAFGALTFNQVMLLIGTLFAVATYFTSLYFQNRRDQREQEFHNRRMELGQFTPQSDTCEPKGKQGQG